MSLAIFVSVVSVFQREKIVPQRIAPLGSRQISRTK